MKKIFVFVFLIFSLFSFADRIPMPILAEHSGIYLCIKNGYIVSTRDFERYEKVCKLPFKYDDNQRYEDQVDVFKWKINEKEFYLVFEVFNEQLSDYSLLFEYKGQNLTFKKTFKDKDVIGWYREGNKIKIEDKLRNLNYKIKLPHYFVKGIDEKVVEEYFKHRFSNRMIKVPESLSLKGAYCDNYLVFIRSLVEPISIPECFSVFNENTKNLLTFKFDHNSSVEKVELVPINDSECLFFVWVCNQDKCFSWGLNDDELLLCGVDFVDIYYIFFKTGKKVRIPVTRSCPIVITDGKRKYGDIKEPWLEPKGFSYLDSVQKLSKDRIALYYTGFSTKGEICNFTLIYNINDLRNAAKFYTNPFEITKIKKAKGKIN